MSSTEMLSANPLAVKLWEGQVWTQAIRRSIFAHVFNRGSVYVPKELDGKDKIGDQATFSHAGKLTKVPVGEQETLFGAEEALELNSHSMVMNESMFAVNVPTRGTIKQQRTKIPFESTAKEMVARRARELFDASLLNQLAGVDPNSFTIDGTLYSSAASKLHVQGLNPIVAPTSERILRAGGVANDQSLTSSNKFTLDLIDYAVEMIEVSNQPIERLSGDTFDLFLHPYQITDLRQDTTGSINWFNIELSKIEGGKSSYIEETFENDIICVGKYNNVFIYSSPRVPTGQNSSTGAEINTVRRAVLVGKDAVSFASPFGSKPTSTDVPLKMLTQLKDYGRYMGIGAMMVYGLKKMTPTNKQDIGSFVISTYAAAHA